MLDHFSSGLLAIGCGRDDNRQFPITDRATTRAIRFEEDDTNRAREHKDVDLDHPVRDLTTSRQTASDCESAVDDRSQVRAGDLSIDPARLPPHNGFVVAFVGSDGSGKSTVTREITGWLAQQAPVTQLYFGTGDGPVSPPRRVLRRIGALVVRWKKQIRNAAPSEPSPESTAEPETRVTPGITRTVWRIAWALLVAHEKKRRLATMLRARRDARIVVCDRYPQAETLGYNDGPLLGGWIEHPRRFLRALAKHELAIYRSFARYPPDLVVKLHVTPAVAAQRKEIASLDRLQRKADGIKRLQYPSSTLVLDVDADRPIEEVLHDVKSAICSRI